MATLQPTLQMRCTKAPGEAWGRGLSRRVEVRGLVQRNQGGKGIKHGSGQGAGPTLSLCPSDLPMAQTWATVGQGEWLRPFARETFPRNVG